MELPEGFSLQEDDHVLTLLYDGYAVANFIASAVKPEAIQGAIAEHLKFLQNAKKYINEKA